MRQESQLYVCPETKKPLRCAPEESVDGQVRRGRLISEAGREFVIRDGVPDLTFPQLLGAEQREALDYYQGAAGIYDDVANLSFRIQYVDEMAARKQFVSFLGLKPDMTVLELACGTGRDSVNIASALDGRGRLFLQDISPAMLTRCKEKLGGASVPIELSVANACFLPFPDKSFDAIFSFGGLGVFGNIRQSLSEIVRVSKPGAKVVVGDESMPPWLYETEYGRILLNNNPLFKAPIPFAEIPVQARDVVVRWLVGGVYYLIEFTVGEGEPKADFDLPIPGRRGGTLRTRYEGRLEGVTPKAKELAIKAAAEAGMSVHQWLDEVVLRAASKSSGTG